LPLAVQGKLLRVIEEKTVDRIGGRAPIPVDVRIVAATNRDLRQAVERGEFRRDLFFRLAVFPVEIPPLRERGEDVTLLARHFAAQLGKEMRGREALLSEAGIKALREHSWPGNVRELENAIERACILADASTLEPADLGLMKNMTTPVEAFNELDMTGTLSEIADRATRFVERKAISEALRLHDGNKTRAAETLGVSYKTLLTKIKDYEL
jgi:DNA-binding NtrC family response regulator